MTILNCEVRIGQPIGNPPKRDVRLRLLEGQDLLSNGFNAGLSRSEVRSLITELTNAAEEMQRLEEVVSGKAK